MIAKLPIQLVIAVPGTNDRAIFAAQDLTFTLCYPSPASAIVTILIDNYVSLKQLATIIFKHIISYSAPAFPPPPSVLPLAMMIPIPSYPRVILYISPLIRDTIIISNRLTPPSTIEADGDLPLGHI